MQYTADGTMMLLAPTRCAHCGRPLTEEQRRSPAVDHTPGPHGEERERIAWVCSLECAMRACWNTDP